MKYVYEFRFMFFVRLSIGYLGWIPRLDSAILQYIFLFGNGVLMCERVLSVPSSSECDTCFENRLVEGWKGNFLDGESFGNCDAARRRLQYLPKRKSGQQMVLNSGNSRNFNTITSTLL